MIIGHWNFRAKQFCSILAFSTGLRLFLNEDWGGVGGDGGVGGFFFMLAHGAHGLQYL